MLKDAALNTIEDLHAVSLIGGVMTCEGPIPPIVADVKPEYWQDHRAAATWAATLRLLAEHKEPTFDAVIDRLVVDGTSFGDATPYVCGLADNCASSANIAHWAKVMIADGSKRVMGEKLAALHGKKLSADEIRIRAESIVAEVATATSAGGLQPTSEYLKPLLLELEREHANPDGERFAAMGLRDLDKDVTMRAGDLTIIAGRPGSGKTALAGNVAAYCARDGSKGSVAMFSMEMAGVQIIRRIVAGGMRVDTRELAKYVGTPELTEQFEKVAAMAMVIDQRAGLTVAEMDAALRKRSHPTRLVIVDYLQISGLDKGIERQDLRIGAITKGLKQIAKRHNCHVIALSQLNRGVESRNPPIPIMSDLKDSGAIEEDADIVMLLYREGYYAKSGGNGVDMGSGQITVAKNRNGAQGLIIEVRWDAKSQRWYDVVRA